MTALLASWRSRAAEEPQLCKILTRPLHRLCPRVQSRLPMLILYFGLRTSAPNSRNKLPLREPKRFATFPTETELCLQPDKLIPARNVEVFSRRHRKLVCCVSDAE